MARYIKRKITEETKREMEETLARNMRKMADHLVCDFCGGDDPVYVYASHRMSTGELRSCWRWCACMVCDALIEKENWTILLERIAVATEHLFMTGGLKVSKDITRMAVEAALTEFQVYAIRRPE